MAVLYRCLAFVAHGHSDCKCRFLHIWALWMVFKVVADRMPMISNGQRIGRHVLLLGICRV